MRQQFSLSSVDSQKYRPGFHLLPVPDGTPDAERPDNSEPVSAPPTRQSSEELLAVTALWRARAAAGDERAERVTDALEWLAQHRAEPKKSRLLSVAERVSHWMGLYFAVHLGTGTGVRPCPEPT